MKQAFTMIELVFVIVVLGILAMVAVPRMNGMTTDASIARGQADVATIRSAIINERQSRLVQGLNGFIPNLSTGVADDPLFTGDGGDRTLLMYGIQPGDWTVAAAGTTAGFTESYDYTINGAVTTFDYNADDGTFTCGNAAAAANCDDLTQ